MLSNNRLKNICYQTIGSIIYFIKQYAQEYMLSKEALVHSYMRNLGYDITKTCDISRFSSIFGVVNLAKGREQPRFPPQNKCVQSKSL
jgi:hypothetical protein